MVNTEGLNKKGYKQTQGEVCTVGQLGNEGKEKTN